MGEQFDVAAFRHFETAEHLETGGHIDDAAYHFGLCGENAVKSAMREAGLEQHWASISNAALRNSPMRGHWGDLSQRIQVAASDINLYAAGRRSTALRVLSSTTTPSFVGWNIDIRYADPALVPVSSASVSLWKADATRFLVKFVIV